MTPRTLSLERADLDRWVEALVANGREVIAPVSCGDLTCEYGPVATGRSLALESGLPRRPLKELFLPPCETLFRWKLAAGKVEIGEPPPVPRRVVIGARPCDVAALAIVDRVMEWGTHDDRWFARRRATVVVGLSCRDRDRSCFCERVGLGPDARLGADAWLEPRGDGFTLEALTPEGLETVCRQFDPGQGSAPERPEASSVEPAPDAPCGPAGAVRRWIDAHLDDPLWNRIGLACHGCGACAAVCPTCHCFDIVDEADGCDRGARRRHRDTCQTALFTLHASGHNPRPSQGSRTRQRIVHKFSTYPARFGATLCTGCGRCARVCPAGVDLPEILESIDRSATTGGGAP